MTDEPKALRLAVLPTVSLPIAVAVVMWIALAAALRRFRGTASPDEKRRI